MISLRDLTAFPGHTPSSAFRASPTLSTHTHTFCNSIDSYRHMCHDISNPHRPMPCQAMPCHVLRSDTHLWRVTATSLSDTPRSR